MVILDQKSLALMNYLVHKFLNPGPVVLDLFVGTLSTSKACVLVEKNHRFVGCDKDFRCLEKLLSGLEEEYASQLLIQACDLASDEEVLDAARNMETAKGRMLRGALDSWSLYLHCYIYRRSRSI